MSLRDEIEGILRCMIETVKATADEMPAPNEWTPRFMGIATSAESFLNRALEKSSISTHSDPESL
jgi:hypothetical protein